MIRLLLLIAFSLTLNSQAKGLKVAVLNRSAPVNFNKEIYPFFKRNCLACHNNGKAKAKLILETADAIRKGSSNGAVVVPGNAEKSLLFTTSAHLVEDVMPPEKNKSKAKNLSPNELALLKLWIDQGAKGSGAVIAEAPREWIKFKAGQPVYALVVSPDGRYAAAGHGQYIDIYDLKLKKQIQRLNDPKLKGQAHLDLVRSLAFDTDGTLASGGYRQIKLWSPSTMASQKYTSNELSVKGAVATSADSSWSLFLNKEMNELKRLNHKSKKEDKLLFKEKVAKIVILHNQKEIAVLFEKGKIRVMKQEIFGAQESKGMFYEWQGHRERPTFATSNSVYPLISADLRGIVTIWDLKNKKPKMLFNNGASLNSFSIAPNSKRLVTTSTKGQVLLWDLNKTKSHLKSLWENPNIKNEIDVLALRKSVTNRHKTRYNNQIKKFTETIKKELESAKNIEKEHEEKVKELIESKKNLSEALAKKTPEKEKDTAKKKREEELKILQDSVASLTLKLPSLLKNKTKSMSMHEKAKVDLAEAEKKKKATEETYKKIDIEIKALYKSQSDNKKELIVGGAFSADETYFAVAYQNGKIYLYTSADGQFIETVHTEKKIKSFLFDKGNTVVTIDDKGERLSWPTQRVWKYTRAIGDGKDGNLLIDRVTALGFSSESSLISASGIPSRKGQLKMWDKKTLKLKAKDLMAHKDLITSITFSPDRQRFVTGSSDGIAKIYESGTLKKLQNLEGHGQAILDTSWSGDGWKIATSSADKKVIFWDTETGEKSKTLLGKGDEVTIVKFMSRTSDSLLTAEGVGQLKANNKTLPGKFSYIYSASLTPDEKLIIAGGQSGELKLWDAKKCTLVKSFGAK